MRRIGFLVFCGMLMMMCTSLVEGQQKGKGQPGGGGFGGFGGPQTGLTLLNRTDVKKELEVSDEQMEKLPAEVMVAISRVLNDKQFKRFKQLDLQQRGNRAFKDEAVQKQLNLSDEQKKSVIAIVDDAAKEIGDLKGKGGFGGFGKGNPNQEKIDTINKESKEKIYTVLSKEQRKNWRDMIGEEFKFTTGFGGFGGFGKDAPKKDAPKKDI